MSCFLKKLLSGVTYNENYRGPKSEPCATHHYLIYIWFTQHGSMVLKPFQMYFFSLWSSSLPQILKVQNLFVCVFRPCIFQSLSVIKVFAHNLKYLKHFWRKVFFSLHFYIVWTSPKNMYEEWKCEYWLIVLLILNEAWKQYSWLNILVGQSNDNFTFQ